MEKPPLEKVIERLEKLDIREWEHDDNVFKARYGGVSILLDSYRDMGMTFSHIEIVSDDRSNRLRYEAKGKSDKNAIKNFYDRLYQRYREFKDKEFEEKIKSLLEG